MLQITRHSVHERLLLIVLVVAAGAQAADSMPDLEDEVRDLTLQQAEKRAAALVRDSAVATIARNHSKAMFRAGTLAHRLDGAGPAERVARHHRTLFGLVAENVAVQKGWPGKAALARRLVEGWMRSPGHRANILSPYDVLEVGCYGTEQAVYCTQLFVRSTVWLASSVDFVQRPGARLSLALSDETPTASRRISIGQLDAEPAGPGTAFEQGLARLPVPPRPGPYQLRLWTQREGDPSRYRIVPGPYVCAVETGVVPGRRCPR